MNTEPWFCLQRREQNLMMKLTSSQQPFLCMVGLACADSFRFMVSACQADRANRQQL